jgi:hypothetical protein
MTMHRAQKCDASSHAAGLVAVRRIPLPAIWPRNRLGTETDGRGQVTPGAPVSGIIMTQTKSPATPL